MFLKSYSDYVHKNILWNPIILSSEFLIFDTECELWDSFLIVSFKNLEYNVQIIQRTEIPQMYAKHLFLIRFNAVLQKLHQAVFFKVNLSTIL